MEYTTWNADPVFIDIMGLTIYWYGLFFAGAILSGLHLLKWVYLSEKKDITKLDPILTYVILGVIIGARLAHCFFYDPQYYFANPFKILAIWEGGLASHGGGTGLLIALYFYSKKYQFNFLWLVDRLTLCTALFGVLVRFANFINSEIVGIPTQVPWGIIFTQIDTLPRHPAQLYESLAYLLILGLLLFTYVKSKKSPPLGLLTGLFLTLTFSARFLIETVKIKQAAYSNDFYFNTGQLLSIPFLVIGIMLLIWSITKRTGKTTHE